jgi:3-oxoacyl-[acyl-carrier-protein] synthase II
MVDVRGIGWITDREFGSVKSGCRSGYSDRMVLRKELFSSPFKGFAKLDPVAAMLCFSIELALKDAGIEYDTDCWQQAGIIGTNSGGCLQSDIRYFRDYLDSGRVMGRGNLFIYTLTSSPLGEAAIHFGMKGPLLYVAAQKGGLCEALEAAADMMVVDGASMMVAGCAEEDEAVYFVLSGREEMGLQGDVLCSLDEAVLIAGRNPGLPGMINEFRALSKERIIK